MTQNSNLREQLRTLVAEIAEKNEVPDGATFKDLGIDSMMGVEIVAAVERQYQIKIDDAELASFKDLDSAYELVVKKLAAKGTTAAAAGSPGRSRSPGSLAAPIAQASNAARLRRVLLSAAYACLREGVVRTRLPQGRAPDPAVLEERLDLRENACQAGAQGSLRLL